MSHRMSSAATIELIHFQAVPLLFFVVVVAPLLLTTAAVVVVVVGTTTGVTEVTDVTDVSVTSRHESGLAKWVASAIG